METTIAYWMIGYGCDDTESGNYRIFRDEIEKAFGLGPASLGELLPKVLKVLRGCNAVAEVDWVEDDGGFFDMYFYLDYCGVKDEED